jgi:hypothetical protein
MFFHNGAPPFALGETYRGEDEDGNLINPHWLGQGFMHKIPAASGSKKTPSGRYIGAVALRNEAGFALLPKRLGSLTVTAGYYLVESVDGYTIGLFENNCVVIDPYLPSAGVADDAIFWGIVSGPVPILTAHAGAGFPADIAVGDLIVASTVNTTNGNSTAGRIGGVTLPGQTGATASLNAALGAIGRALSARTTGETGADLLVNVHLQGRV